MKVNTLESAIAECQRLSVKLQDTMCCVKTADGWQVLSGMQLAVPMALGEIVPDQIVYTQFVSTDE